MQKMSKTDDKIENSNPGQTQNSLNLDEKDESG